MVKCTKQCKRVLCHVGTRRIPSVSQLKLPPQWLFLEYKSAPPLDLVVADPCRAYTKQVPWRERPLNKECFKFVWVCHTKFFRET